jgi:AI-2 transport protein TqsA
MEGMNEINNSRISPAAMTIIVGGCLVLIIFGLRVLSFFINIAFLAVIITITLTPMVNWLKKKGWPRGLATAATVVLLLIGALIVLFFLMHSFGDLGSSLSTIHDQIVVKMNSIDTALAKFGIDARSVTSTVANLVLQGVKIASGLIEAAISFLSTIGLAVVAAIFMLFEEENFTRGFAGKFGSNMSFGKNLNQFMGSVRAFIVVTTLVGLVGGAVIGVALYLIGVPNPIAWGVMFWLLNYIPYVGLWLALIPPTILASLTLGSPYGLAVILIYVVVSNVIKVFLLPKVMGDKVDTTMTLGLLSIFFWGVVLGVFGMLLAYPYTLLVRDLLLTNTSETWLVDIMKKGDSG